MLKLFNLFNLFELLEGRAAIKDRSAAKVVCTVGKMEQLLKIKQLLKIEHLPKLFKLFYLNSVG